MLAGGIYDCFAFEWKLRGEHGVGDRAVVGPVGDEVGMRTTIQKEADGGGEDRIIITSRLSPSI